MERARERERETLAMKRPGGSIVYGVLVGFVSWGTASWPHHFAVLNQTN